MKCNERTAMILTVQIIEQMFRDYSALSDEIEFVKKEHRPRTCRECPATDIDLFREIQMSVVSNITHRKIYRFRKVEMQFINSNWPLYLAALEAEKQSILEWFYEPIFSYLFMDIDSEWASNCFKRKAEERRKRRSEVEKAKTDGTTDNGKRVYYANKRCTSRRYNFQR